MAVNIAGLLGMLLGSFMTCLFLGNGAVLYVILKEKMYSKKSPIYIIAASNLFVDNAMILLHLVYFIPSLMMEDWLFSKGIDDPKLIFLSTIFMMLWYCISISQILMATNRLIVMCFQEWNLFTLRNTIRFVLCVYPLSAMLAVMSQYILPCCRFSFNYQVFSYIYVQLPGMFNYPNYFIDLPLNSLSSFICFCCYSAIVWWMHNLSKGDTTDKSGRKQRKMEYKYAMQFCIISLFYLLTWTSFRIFPLLIGTSNLALYILCPIGLTISCGANGLVYIKFNNDIRNFIFSRRVSAVSETSKSNQYSVATTRARTSASQQEP